MKRIIKLIAIFLVVHTVVSLPLYAADLATFGLNIPNINSVAAPDQPSSGTTGLDTALESPIDPQEYIMGPGDTIAVHILISGNLFVDHNLVVGADGHVFFPKVGAIYLSGITLAQAKDRIDARIKSEFDRPYKLYVMLSQPKKVKIYLSGMVKNPGPLAIYDGSRVSEVLSLSGGIASGASNRYVYIKRRGTDGKESLLKADLFDAYRSKDLTKDIRVLAGDVIEVPSADNVLVSQSEPGSANDKLLFEGKENFVYMYGEVVKSGRYEFVPGKRLSDYISYAGGPTPKALLGSVSITRQVNGKPKKIDVNASDVIYNGNEKNDFEILGGDVVSVPGNWFYFSDIYSFSSLVFTLLALYTTFAKR